MAAKGKSSVEVQRNFEGIIAILTSAACEWFLMFLLFVNALLSYLLAKVAVYCDLQKPCILCSRFEHVIGNESSQLYEELLCSNHTSTLASWFASQIYGKDNGAGVHEDYYFRSNREMHMYSVGNSISDIESPGPRRRGIRRSCAHPRRPGISRSCSHSPAYSPVHSPVHSPVGVGQSSYSYSPWGRRENFKGQQPKSSGPKPPRPNIPLPCLPNRGHPNRSRDNSKRIKNKSPASVSSCCSAKVGADKFSHVGYFFSDNDSEFLFSDWDNASSASSVNNEPMMEGLARSSRYRPRTPSNGSKSGRHRNWSSKPRRSLSEPWPVFPKASDVKLETGLGELNCQQSSWKSNSSALPELISLDDFSSPNVLEKDVNGTGNIGYASTNKNVKLLKSVCAEDGASVKSDPALIKPNHSNVNAVSESDESVREIDSSSITTEALINPNHSNVNATSESEGYVKERGSFGITTEAHIKPDQRKVNAVSQSDRSVEETDSSGVSIEQPTVKEPNRVDEEMKLLPQGGSSAQGINSSTINTSLTVDGCVGEKQTTEASSSTANPMLHTSTSVESGPESVDGGYVTEIEGESIVDRLKRQVNYDRKNIKELYKELEEERSAASIAANQAMAMITKLHEEKSAFHMEALHYLRMMEEQAEFDADALQKANDLLAEKGKEIQDLEAELEYSKLGFQDESMMENVLSTRSDYRGGSNPVETTVMPGVKNDISVSCNSMATEVSNGGYQPLFSETTLLEFEDEKLYITNCLKNLERKLSEISSRGHSPKMPDEQNQAEAPTKVRALNGQLDEHVLQGEKDIQISNCSSADCHGGHDMECVENNNSGSHWQRDIPDPRELDLVCLENEISDLNDRLDALETDHDFLERVLYSLQNGAEGLKFVQEIASQLQELRKIGTSFR